MLQNRLTALCLLALSGCASAPTSVVPEHVETGRVVVAEAPTLPAEDSPQRTPIQVAWSAIASSPGCFFFSGPGDLGRDDHLGTAASWVVRGAGVSLDFGASAVFRGSRTGDQVALSRRSSHDYSSKWNVSEQIQGTVSSGQLEASYEYHECDTAHDEPCQGECTITARLTAGPLPP